MSLLACFPRLWDGRLFSGFDGFCSELGRHLHLFGEMGNIGVRECFVGVDLGGLDRVVVLGDDPELAGVHKLDAGAQTSLFWHDLWGF